MVTDYSIKRYSKYTREELLHLLKEYANNNNLNFVPVQKFCHYFGISKSTINRHFGKWSLLCKEAGLNPRYDFNVSKEDLFNNLNNVWEILGRQPRAKELKQPLSPISISRYQRFFKKSWYEICLEFMSWKSGTPVKEIERELLQPPITESESQSDHRTNRNINLSLRYTILKRDNFKCVKCGASPASNPGTQLHIDHKTPWSKGGETEVENLQTLCSDCNLGKSDRL